MRGMLAGQYVLAWIRQALALPRVRLLPLTPEIAIGSTRLPAEFPGDPADRILVSTARQNGAPLVSKDARFRSLSDVKTVW
jgi:PIN domain nuclease of toxin-antitoxin system